VPELPVPQDRILVLRRDGMEWIWSGARGRLPEGSRGCKKERARAAAAPALPRNVEWPLDAGCSDRQGAADVGHDRSRPV